MQGQPYVEVRTMATLPDFSRRGRWGRACSSVDLQHARRPRLEG